MMALAKPDDRFRRIPTYVDDDGRRGPNGRRLCRQCETEVTPPRRTFCSKPCTDAWLLARTPAMQRREVFRRDGGKCRACDLDIEALERRVRALVMRARRRSDWQRWTQERSLIAHKREKRIAAILRAAGFTLWRSFWEMDHIRPVVMGGGSCDLSNLRTLCVPCHRLVTAELARRRAARRRLQSDRTEKGE